MPSSQITRRGALVLLAVAPALTSAQAQALPKIVVTRDPSCGCCGGWIAHLRTQGFAADLIETSDLNAVKQRLGVPDELASCHTAEVAGYVIEGHVPAAAIKRLLQEKPQARGLAVPGMPIGSPGMEVPNQPPETYDVILFGPGLRKSFARYRGASAL